MKERENNFWCQDAESFWQKVLISSSGWPEEIDWSVKKQELLEKSIRQLVPDHRENFLEQIINYGKNISQSKEKRFATFVFAELIWHHYFWISEIKKDFLKMKTQNDKRK